VSDRVIFSGPARQDLRRLDRETARRVTAALTRLAETGHGDVKRLTGHGTELRLRVGDWRVRFERDTTAGSINVLRILPRGRAYRD
jgi:mRNA-degrading endonuclease RelE of RelBE toxin-antitoxin system